MGTILTADEAFLILNNGVVEPLSSAVARSRDCHLAECDADSEPGTGARADYSENRAWRMARNFAKAGISIIPIPPHEKGCVLAGWPDKATSDIEQITCWEGSEPEGNYGCVCTPDTIAVLDADNPGLRSHIERQTGKDFPDTLTVASNKGYHYYFRQTEKTRAIGNRSLAGMFDLQSDRKYVVGAGSTHPSGKRYTLLSDTAIAPMPDWLADWLDKASKPAKSKITGLPETHEDFEPDEWYDFHDIDGRDDGEWFIPDECPFAGHRHEQSVKTGFYYNGTVWGWHDFATGCNGHDMTIGEVVAFMNQRRRDAGLPVWNKPIWKEDDSDLEGVDIVDGCDEFTELEPATLQVSEELAERQEGRKTASGLKALASISNDDFDLTLVTRSAADYDMKELRWLWPNKIPLGKMVLFTGKPDGGKTMCSLDVAARVSTGSDWPDGSKNENRAGKVLIAASEDDPDDTLVPRLTAAGANLHNIEIVVCTMLTSKGKHRKKSLNLKRDARMLIEAVKANPDIQLLILDPITSFFGEADQNKDKDIRPIMDALKVACEKSGLTVIGIIHSNKRSDVDAVHKVSGAGSLAAAVRAVWGFSRDSEDKKLFHMAHVKGNLTEKKAGLDYRIESTPVAIEEKLKDIPHVVWGDEFDGDADDLLAASREQRDKSDYKISIAKSYLRAVWYPIKAKELYERAQQAEGLTSNVLKKAKMKLWNDGFRIVAKQPKGESCWCWYHEEDGELVKDKAATIESATSIDEAT